MPAKHDPETSEILAVLIAQANQARREWYAHPTTATIHAYTRAVTRLHLALLIADDLDDLDTTSRHARQANPDNYL